MEWEEEDKEKTGEKNKVLNKKLIAEIRKIKKKHDETFVIFQKKMDHHLEKCKYDNEIGLAK